MHKKIISFAVITGILTLLLPLVAGAEIERRDIVCATLDAIEGHLKTDTSLARVNPPAVTPNFFSDFSLNSPFLNILTLHRIVNSPILALNGEMSPKPEDELPDLPEECLSPAADLSGKSGFEDFTLLDKYNQRWIELYLGASYGALGGHTNSNIDFDTGKSELEFPLENWAVFGARIAAAVPPLKLILDNSAYMNTNDKSGDMYDSDWEGDNLLTSDTVSDAYLKLLIWDSSLGYVFWQNSDSSYDDAGWNLAFTVLGGYRHEYLKYTIYNVYNTSRAVLTSSGQVSKYRVTYNLPYLGLKMNFARSQANWGASGRVCFSPSARANDVKDDFLESKRFFGECDGWAALLGANVFWNIEKAWTLQAGVDYANIRTSGHQVQLSYAGARTDNIDMDINSNQVYWWGRINYKF